MLVLNREGHKPILDKSHLLHHFLNEWVILRVLTPLGVDTLSECAICLADADLDRYSLSELFSQIMITHMSHPPHDEIAVVRGTGWVLNCDAR